MTRSVYPSNRLSLDSNPFSILVSPFQDILKLHSNRVGTAIDTRSRSLQRALLVPILDAHTDSNLAIRALHYLYYLVVARKHGVHVLELAQELPSILASG